MCIYAYIYIHIYTYIYIYIFKRHGGCKGKRINPLTVKRNA